jgi:hypothetical protein
MTAPIAIFLDFNLPNATTWFFFSLLLAVALFFKFSRIVSIRNLDVVLIFLLVPGFLVLQAARPKPTSLEQQAAVQIASLVGQGSAGDSAAIMTTSAVVAQQCGPELENPRWVWFAYLWILIGSIYFFWRCLFDLTLVQRPALAPNLQISGLAWLAGALLICLLAVAYRQLERQMSPVPLPANSSVQFTEPADHPIFAVAILWRPWPAWGVALLAFVCHITVIAGLVLIGWQHFQDLSAGMAAATFYLMLPYTGHHVGQLHHVLPMALFIGVLLAYRWPTVAGGILGIATAATYFPALVLPVWLSFYRGRGAGRFFAAFVLALALGLLNIAISLWASDEFDRSLQLGLETAAWQPWKGPTFEGLEGFWTGMHWVYRIPVFVLFLSFVIFTLFWPMPKNLAHVIALSAAIFIGLQFWCADQGGIYVLWYMPLMLLLTFRPNLQDRVALPIVEETDWLTRSLRWCVRAVRRIAKRPEPAQTHAA